jgi:hypothetical protein
MQNYQIVKLVFDFLWFNRKIDYKLQLEQLYNIFL